MKFWISLFFIFHFNSSLAQIPTAGLEAFYPFSGNYSDSSGNGNHAIGSGGSFVNDRFDNPASAVSLSSNGDSIILPISGFTPFSGDFTISFWIKTKSPEVLNIFSLKNFPGDTVNNFEMQFNSISVLQPVLESYYSSFTYWNGSGWVGNNLEEGAPGLYYNNKWQHYLIRRSNDTLQFWHNRDMLVESYYIGTIGDALPLVIGSSPHHFDGAIDDIACYNRAVTDAEIAKLFHDHLPFYFKSPKKTDAYVQNDSATVLWMWDAEALSDSIDLQYRINQSGNWINTTQNQLVDWTPFYFPLNYSPGTKLELRIRDRQDTTLQAETGAFTISEYAWQLVNSTLPFTPRDGCGLLNFNGKMWLLGGWDPPNHASTNYTCSELWSSMDGNSWTYHGDAPWASRHCSGWLVHDSAMWVVGGDPQSGALRDVWKSTDGINWLQILDSIPNMYPLRTMHMTASMNGYMYNFGGQSTQYIHENLSEVWRSLDGASWTKLPDAPWIGRGMVLSSCVDDLDTLWLLGGGRLNDRRCYNDVWKTGDGINWQQVTEAAPWQSRYWHNVVWFDNKMWVISGIVNQTDNDETWYSSDGIEWFELKNGGFFARHAAAATVFDNALWLMTGIITNDSWKLINTVTTDTEEQEQVIEFPISVYPIPASNMLHIQFTHSFPDGYVIELYNVYGQLIISERSQSQESMLDISTLASGVYLLTVETTKNRQTFKVIKE